jgi:aspartate ammonia-lyase
MRTGKSVVDLVRERKLLSQEQMQKLVDVQAVIGQR